LPKSQRSRLPRQEPMRALLSIARDLTASLAAEDRYDRLIAAVRRVIPADAVCLLRLEDDALAPLAAYGLSEAARVRRYRQGEHPRLDIILGTEGPVRFPPDSPLPDPFDGMLKSDPQALRHIHACLGCTLVDGGEVIGALTADALEPRAFDRLDTEVLSMLGALAAAAVRTTTLIDRLERTAAHQGAVARALQRAASEQSGGEIVGRSRAMRRLLEGVDLVARSDLPVLITGETGAGKELVARRLHELSARREEPLIYVNCAALPEAIAESELFGHVAGAFTGAIRDRAGRFEIADHGTLFLDEIGELPLPLQAKLLRALQHGEIQRVGSDRAHRVDVRLVAATNRNLGAEIEAGRFRADLFHRLAVFPVQVPALRERPEDIPVLAAHFLDGARRRLGLPSLRLTEAARRRLMEADWPGNVRELENVISRAALRVAARAAVPPGPHDERRREVVMIDVEVLGLGETGVAAEERGRPFGATPGDGAALVRHAPGGRPGRRPAGIDHDRAATIDPEQAGPLRERVRAFEKRMIEEAVERRHGNWAAAARDLGLHRGNLHHLARRLGLR